jgi:hypothetical protein
LRYVQGIEGGKWAVQAVMNTGASKTLETTKSKKEALQRAESLNEGLKAAGNYVGIGEQMAWTHTPEQAAARIAEIQKTVWGAKGSSMVSQRAMAELALKYHAAKGDRSTELYHEWMEATGRTEKMWSEDEARQKLRQAKEWDTEKQRLLTEERASRTWAKEMCFQRTL